MLDSTFTYCQASVRKLKHCRYFQVSNNALKVVSAGFLGLMISDVRNNYIDNFRCPTL